MTARILLVGLDPPETDPIVERVEARCVVHPALPRIKVVEGRLLTQGPSSVAFVEIDKVVFHGIFADDFDFLCGLALWGGPCFPDAMAMMDCRLKLPGLIRASRVSRFGAAARGFAGRGTRLKAEAETVAKWGNWHCGEDKARFTGDFEAQEATWFEPFFTGQAVRVVAIGQRHWQIRLGGEGWLKSIHHADADFMALDPELLEDTLRLRAHFGLDLIGVDYIVGDDGHKHLLEVNHIPSVTCFAEIRQAWLDQVTEWIDRPA